MTMPVAEVFKSEPTTSHAMILEGAATVAGPCEILPQQTQSLSRVDSPPRPAWLEIDLKRLRRNFELINKDKPPGLQLLSVVKDEGYGHGAVAVAQTAVECGAKFLALSTVEEAVALREHGIQIRLL